MLITNTFDFEIHGFNRGNKLYLTLYKLKFCLKYLYFVIKELISPLEFVNYTMELFVESFWKILMYL